MATKKPVTTRALAPWDAEMAAAAARQAKAEKPVGGMKSISTRGGMMSIDKQPIKGNELRCVILGSVLTNEYFTDAFDPDTPQAPACYAFGDHTLEDPEPSMAPHAEAEDKQSDRCSSCHMNEYGSADKGRGKACKNVRRLALVTEDALESADAMMEAEMRTLKVPVMSVQHWSQYVREKLADEVGRPYFGVVTRVYIVPDAKSQFRIKFEFAELITFDQELYEALQKRCKGALQMLTSPYPKFSEKEEEEAPAPRRGAAAKKAPAKAPAKSAGRAKY